MSVELTRKTIVSGDDPRIVDVVCRNVFGTQYIGKQNLFNIMTNDTPVCTRAGDENLHFPDAINIYLGVPNNTECFDIIIGSHDEKILEKELIKQYDCFQRGNGEKIIAIDPSVVYPTQHIRDFSEKVILEYEEEIKKHPDVEYKITGNCIDGSWYVFDGHHRLAAEIRQNSPLIQMELSKEGYSPLEKSDFYDFEDLCGFRYQYYPEPVNQMIKIEQTYAMER